MFYPFGGYYIYNVILYIYGIVLYVLYMLYVFIYVIYAIYVIYVIYAICVIYAYICYIYYVYVCVFYISISLWNTCWRRCIPTTPCNAALASGQLKRWVHNCAGLCLFLGPICVIFPSTIGIQ